MFSSRPEQPRVQVQGNRSQCEPTATVVTLKKVITNPALITNVDARRH